MSRILAGIRVLDLSSFVSGPYACQILAEMGAEVIKVERPDGGDPFRSFSPDQYSASYCAHNRHKKSIAVNLSHPSGVKVLKALVEQTDVLVENFRPGVMKKLGLEWSVLSEINPRLLYCSITGFGSTGPYKQRPAYDTVIQAISGLLGQFMEPDRLRITGPNVADSVASLYAVIGVLGGLFARNNTGRGSLIEVPMIDAVIAFATNPLAQFFATGETPGPYQRPSQSQCYVFKCADDKLISIHLSAPTKFWEALLEAIEGQALGSDIRFATNSERIRNYHDLGDALAPRFGQRKRDEWMKLLEHHGVPFAPVNDFAEVAADEQVRHLGTFFEVVHPQKGAVTSIARPIFFNGERDFDAAPPPVLGEHTEEVLKSCGFEPLQIAELQARGVL